VVVRRSRRCVDDILLEAEIVVLVDAMKTCLHAYIYVSALGSTFFPSSLFCVAEHSVVMYTTGSCL